jgi:phosphopantothenoylcysteine decarboxylase/phosphopantothenate--cysteine ligase
VEYGRDKLTRKGLDAVVVNDVAQPGIGFDAADNEVTVVTADGEQTVLRRAGKDEIADGILDRLQELLNRTGERNVRGARADRAARV